MADIARMFTILMADDDVEDCALAEEALREADVPHTLRFVPNGEELLAYMNRQGEYVDHQTAPRPDLVLLDLNMPRKDGREALRELKADPRWTRLRVVVLTTSTAEDDINFCYQAGAASFIAKPVTFHAWVDLMRDLSRYWFELNQLPPR